MSSILKKLTGYKQSLDKPALRPKAVLLDINGTVFSVNAAQSVFTELGLDPQHVEVGNVYSTDCSTRQCSTDTKRSSCAPSKPEQWRSPPRQQAVVLLVPALR